jgi:hypothetical protein
MTIHQFLNFELEFLLSVNSEEIPWNISNSRLIAFSRSFAPPPPLDTSPLLPSPLLLVTDIYRTASE